MDDKKVCNECEKSLSCIASWGKLTAPRTRQGISCRCGERLYDAEVRHVIRKYLGEGNLPDGCPLYAPTWLCPACAWVHTVPDETHRMVSSALQHIREEHGGSADLTVMEDVFPGEGIYDRPDPLRLVSRKELLDRGPARVKPIVWLFTTHAPHGLHGHTVFDDTADGSVVVAATLQSLSDVVDCRFVVNSAGLAKPVYAHLVRMFARGSEDRRSTRWAAAYILPEFAPLYPKMVGAFVSVPNALHLGKDFYNWRVGRHSGGVGAKSV